MILSVRGSAEETCAAVSQFESEFGNWNFTILQSSTPQYLEIL